MTTPRLTLTKSWYGYSDTEAQVILRAIEEPETVSPEQIMDTEKKPIQVSPLVDRVLLLAVVADLVAEQRRTLARLELRVTQLETALSRWQQGQTCQEDSDDHTYHDGTIAARVVEPRGPAQ